MKDYYKILGILDDAEDIIIRAAFRALAQKYHPDKWNGEDKEANQKMSEINEAYDVLSNKEKREKYDNEYFYFQERNETKEEENLENTNNNEENEAWNFACEFFPALKFQYQELSKISNILGNTFKTALIANKNFDQSQEYKNKLQSDYLERYYGEDKEIQDFAKRLLLNNYKKEAIYVNKIVRTMGSSINYNKLYEKILQEFPRLKQSSEFYDRDGIDFILKSLRNGVYNDAAFIKLYERFFGKTITIKKGLISRTFSDGSRDLNEDQLINTLVAKIKNIYQI